MSPLDWTPNDGDPLDRVDWNEARALMKRVIAANLRGRIDSDELDDLVQEACVGLMRAVERGGIRSLEAITVLIAKRVAIDFMRRRRNTEPLPEAGLGEIPAPGEVEEWVTPEEAQLYLREIMAVIGDKCRELFDLWCKTLNFRLVAESLGEPGPRIRQRYKRCRETALEICLADNGPLGQWARETKGLA